MNHPCCYGNELKQPNQVTGAFWVRNFVLRTIYLRNKAGTKTKNIAKINTILSNKIRLIDDDDDLFIATCDVIAYITCRYQFLDSFRSGKINAEAYAKMRDRARSANFVWVIIANINPLLNIGPKNTTNGIKVFF